MKRYAAIPVLLIAGMLAGCATDGGARPTPSQITDAVVILSLIHI